MWYNKVKKYCNFKGDIHLEKIAILNINSDSVKMQLVKVNKNKSYSSYRKVSMPINLTKDFYGDNFIKPSVIAANATPGLNVEPQGKAPPKARLNSGLSSFASSSL